MKTKIIMLATSPNYHGGIASVLRMYQNSRLWDEYDIKWISTSIDKNLFLKIFYVIHALIVFSFHLHKAKIVHMHYSSPISAKRKCIFAYLVKLFGKRLISHIHYGNQLMTVDKKYYSYLFDKSDVVIVLSNTIKNLLIERFSISSEKIKVIYNPAPIDVAWNSKNTSGRLKQILFIGTICANKGYDTLLKAFSLVSNKYPEWRIVFAGVGELSKAKETAQNLRISDKVSFIGWADKQKKYHLLNTSSFLCSASYAEGFPMAIIEAWSFNLPVICTPVGGVVDVIIDGENSLLFEPGDYTELARQIERFIVDEYFRESVSKEGHKLIESYFSLDIIASQISNIYKRLN